MEQPTISNTQAEFDEDFLEWEERYESIPYLAHCIAGSMAGVTEHLAMLPFDTIKTHVQVSEGKFSAFDTAKRLYAAEGMSKFWRGASFLASGCVPAHALYFSVYELSKLKLLPKLHDQKNQIYPYAYALTGVLATSIHDLVLTPFDMMKQRAQLAPQGLRHFQDLFGYIIKNEGIFSLFRGYPVTLMMNVPAAAAVVSVNESLKVLYRPKNGHNVLSYFACAGLAGSAAAIITIPLDNIKTRLQTQNFFNDSRKEEKVKVPTSEKSHNTSKAGLFRTAASSLFAPKNYYVTVKENAASMERNIKYRDIMSTIQTILREEGMRGFVKGVVPRIFTQAPAAAISWTAYEMLKKFLKSSKLY